MHGSFLEGGLTAGPFDLYVGQGVGRGRMTSMNAQGRPVDDRGRNDSNRREIETIFGASNSR